MFLFSVGGEAYQYVATVGPDVGGIGVLAMINLKRLGIN